MPRVLGRNQRAGLQRLAPASAQIAQIANGRRDHVEAPGSGFYHYNPRLYAKFKERRVWQRSLDVHG